jgi:hypothetical protein
MIIKKQLGLRILSWNCKCILHGVRELNLANLVTANDVDLVALAEPGKKTRVMLLVKTDVAVKTNARLANEYLSDEFPSVLVQLDSHAMRNGNCTALCRAVLLCAVYRR